MFTMSYSFLLRVYIYLLNMFTYTVCVFRAMSHELFVEQVKGTSSTYTQSEGKWTGVQRYSYQCFSKRSQGLDILQL